MGKENIKKLILDLCGENDPFWKVHILAVVDNAIKLAKKFDADKEVCEVSAWLHDISKLEGTSEMHHVLGSKRAEEILVSEGFDKDFIKKVKDCILKHSSDKNYVPFSLEERIVACSDSVSRFDVFLEISVKTMGKFDNDSEKAKVNIIKKYEKSFKKIMPEIKDEYQKKFDAIKLILGK